jgi:hypothetical protein
MSASRTSERLNDRPPVLPKAVPSRMRKTPRRPDLSIDQILQWADAHHERTRRWPMISSGYIPETIDDTWQRIDMGLRVGCRGLPRKSGLSLARLLNKRRGVRNPCAPPPLTVKQVIEWAKSHHETTGKWPTCHSGQVPPAPGETWRGLDFALRQGRRGLPGGMGLSRFLTLKCGAPVLRSEVPRLSNSMILQWADAHHERTGEWPGMNSGAIPEVPGVSWKSLDDRMRRGRHLRGKKTSLCRLLAQKRGVRTSAAPPPLSYGKILKWCDMHHRRTGRWPAQQSGAVAGVPGETWSNIDSALRNGRRGLGRQSSLAELLERERGVRNRAHLSRLTYAKILRWCDAHKGRTGKWPVVKGGPILDVPGETWSGVNASLENGSRGLPGGMSLPRLLRKRRGVRNQYRPPPLSIPKILKWCRAHERRTGKWPTKGAGSNADCPGENWESIERALRRGWRGLPGGSSLEKLQRSRAGRSQNGRGLRKS